MILKQSAAKVIFAVLSVVVLFPGDESSSANGASVLVVTLNSIYQIWPPSPLNLTDKQYTLDYKPGYVTTLDFNYGNRSFCYIHPKVLNRGSEFLCVSADDFTHTWKLTTPTLFPSQYAVSAMAYDWASGAWYFLDKLQRCLYVCDGSLRHCRMLRRDVEDPRGLAVDPTPPGSAGHTAGFIFWSQNNTMPSRLVRSDLSGGDVTPLIPDCSGACSPKALTLDVMNKLIYWVDDETGTVQKSNYDGTGKTTVYTIIEAYNKDIKTFSLFMSTIYLPGYCSVVEAPSDSNETYTDVHGFPSIAAVFHESRQPKVSHPCAEKNGGCEHICVTSYEGVAPVARCLCQHGFQLDATKHGVCSRVKLDSYLLVSRAKPPVVEVRSPLSDSGSPDTLVTAPVAAYRPTVADVDLQTEYLYFFDVFLRQIIRRKLDGTGREVFIKDGIGECLGLAVDWLGGNLYWTDEHTSRVSVARLADPTQHRVLVRASFDYPASIVLDPPRGVMYWSTRARAAKGYGSIEAANMDGSGRRTLISTGLELPNGLVLDAEKQVLYWCDTRFNKIESLELASNQRTTILAAPQAAIKEPYGLVLVDGGLAWSEQGSGLIRRIGAGGNITLVEALTPPLFDIRIVSKNHRGGGNACSVANGGCAELCLAAARARTCACAGERAPLASDPTRCGDKPHLT